VTRRLAASVATIVASALLLAATPAAFGNIPPLREIHYGPLSTEIVTIFEPNNDAAALPAARTRVAPTTGAPLLSANELPAVVLVHGGGWRQQPNLTEQPTVAQSLRQNGFVVFDINYPQANAKEAAFPKQPEAIAAATMWVKEHGATYGANPENVVLLGGSAGGNLADLVGEDLPAVRAVVSLSGPTNLVALVAQGQAEGLKSSLAISLSIALGCGRELVGWEKILGCTNIATQEMWSPVDNVPPASSCPNWLLFSAEEDLVPLSQAQEMLAALHAGGCNAALDVVPEKGHSFGYWSKVSAQIFAFLREN
jgi:triacylglycerol lipase/alpha-L-fucosidase 2